MIDINVINKFILKIRKLTTVMKANKAHSKPYSWKSVACSLRPPSRWGHSSCIVKDNLYIFGGFANATYMNDLWCYSLNERSWKQIITFGDIPLCRSNSTLSYDPVNEQLLLFGGGGPNKQRFNSVSTLDLNTLHWFEIPPFEAEASPWQRTYHIAQFKFPYLIVFGGEGADDLGDLWLYNVTNLSWEQIKIQGQKPTARRFHSSCMVENKIYIFGGCYGKYNCLADLHCLDLTDLFQTGQINTLEWKKVELIGEITQRWGHTSHYYNGEMYVFGGRSLEDMNDMFSIDLKTGTVKKILTSNQPAARRRHGGGFIGSCLVIFGGFDGNYYDDLFYINLFQKRAKTYILKPVVQCLVEVPKQYVLDVEGKPFYIHCALIGKYFKNYRKMVSFLQDINKYYTRDNLQNIFNSLYSGYGKLQLDQAHQKLLSWLPQLGVASPYEIIQNYLNQQKSEVIGEIATSYCVKLQNSLFNTYLNKMKEHWQMSDYIVLNNQYFFNCSFDIMAIYNHYFKFLFAFKGETQEHPRFSFQCNPQIFHIFLAYLHTNILVISNQFSYNVFKELAHLAEYFSIQRLIHICEQELIGLISQGNYMDLLAFSSEFKMETLEELCSLRCLSQLAESRSNKQGLILTSQEDKYLDKKSKQLYNEMKFDLIHFYQHQTEETNAKVGILGSEKENNIDVPLGRKVFRNC